MAVLIGVFWYWGRPGYYRRGLGEMLEPWIGYSPLHPYAWWAVCSLVIRVGIPLLVIGLVYRESARDFGWRLHGEREVWKIYAGFYVLMVPIVFAASFLPGFQHTYPFGDVARISPMVMAQYEVLYGIQFLGVEAFFRGWLLFAVARYIGHHAIFVMMLPYVMIHFGKPPLEAFAAIFAGVALGWLALESKTFIHGFLLHWAVAITMDVCAIWQKGGFLN